MADTKLSDLSEVTDLEDNDSFYVIQGGQSRSVRTSKILDRVANTTILIPEDTKLTNSPGTPGQLSRDSDNLYVCIGADTWKKIELTDI